MENDSIRHHLKVSESGDMATAPLDGWKVVMKRVFPFPTRALNFLVFLTLLVSACSAGESSSNSANRTARSGAGSDSGQIIAEGQIVPKQYVDLRFPIPGFIDQVILEENQPVKTGDVIAVMTGYEEMAATIADAKTQIMSAQQSLDDLYKEADKVREAANQTLAQARQDLQDALDERTSKLYGKTNSLVLDGAISQYYTSLEVYSEALEEFDKVDHYPQNYPDRNLAWIQLTDASKNTYVKKAQLNELLSYPDKLQVEIADATIEVAEAFFNRAEQEHNELIEGPDPDELEQAKATLRAAELQLESAQKMVDDLQLKAPMDGVVVTNDLVVGEFYLAGASPAVVVADFSYWQLETTDVTELNVNQIKVGDPVEIKIDSIPNLDLSGKVTKIDAIGMESQGDITYTVTIDLDQQDERLRWNMTGVVLFQTE